jgi:hypothetical protein
MGLREILSISQSVEVSDQGELRDTFVVKFLTEATSGAKSVTVPAADFSPEVATARAEERATEIDSAVTGGGR